ncbi:type 4a pilus biogenesis protein PilO [Cohnella hashimotonis]|uniref:Type 4a pilus biogenesis protein PilO n=1 Tax=Cohnella hashimotonis TaxID=2826895 RepID=A0ABT6TBV9_9BACL|nr:type 4a pilus biogenesis protein PilO [Cohnella hashimotonis]MDI4644323.1 type 4a pilus biogenesis protein PilO [Cohnella hashimotonis]
MTGLQTQLNKRSLSLIGVVLLFLLLLMFVVYKQMPLNSELSDQRDQIASLRSQSDLLTKKAAEGSAAGAELSDASVQQALPLSDNTEQMLLDLKKISQATGVALLNATFSASDTNQLQSMLGGEQTPYASVGELKTAVAIEGTYDRLLEWVGALQKLERLVSVDNFAIAKPAAADLGKAMTLNVNFTAYFDPSYRNLVDEELLPYKE